MFDPRKDADGIEAAILELLEESYAHSRTARVPSETTREHMMAGRPPRKLSPAYYRLADYLLWLDQVIKTGLRIRQATEDEVTGLCALSCARDKFERQHPPCYQCGLRQQSEYAVACWSCNAEFKR
jgi:hypothetical protein